MHDKSYDVYALARKRLSVSTKQDVSLPPAGQRNIL